MFHRVTQRLQATAPTRWSSLRQAPVRQAPHLKRIASEASPPVMTARGSKPPAGTPRTVAARLTAFRAERMRENPHFHAPFRRIGRKTPTTMVRVFSAGAHLGAHVGLEQVCVQETQSNDNDLENNPPRTAAFSASNVDFGRSFASLHFDKTVLHPK